MIIFEKARRDGPNPMKSRASGDVNARLVTASSHNQLRALPASFSILALSSLVRAHRGIA